MNHYDYLDRSFHEPGKRQIAFKCPIKKHAFRLLYVLEWAYVNLTGTHQGHQPETKKQILSGSVDVNHSANFFKEEITSTESKVRVFSCI